MATVPLTSLQQRPLGASTPDPQHLLMAASMMQQMGKFDQVIPPKEKMVNRLKAIEGGMIRQQAQSDYQGLESQTEKVLATGRKEQGI